MAEKSILPPEMSGVMFISSRRGVGKTMLASQADNPANILFIDLEEKGRGIHNQLQFGAYYSLAALSAGKGVYAMWDETLKIIKDIPAGKFTVAIFDNISPLELAMKAEATRNAKQYAKDFSLQESNISAGRYGGANAVVNFLISDKICAPLFAKGIRLIIVTAHVKPPWAGGQPVPNKWNIKGADRWQELSILTLVLIPSGTGSKVPAAIVQKEQLGSIRYDAELGEFVMRSRLPLRIPACTFKEIKKYLREPADLENPAPGESIVPEEYYAFSEELSKEQLGLVTASITAETQANQMLIATLGAAANGEAPAVSGGELSEEQTEKVKALKAEGKSASEIREILAESGVTVPLSIIVRIK